MSKKISFRAIMEVLGTPKEHVEKTAQGLIDTMKERKDFEVVKNYISDAKETKVGENQGDIKFFSVVLESEIGVENIEKLIGFCFDFMPSSVDVIEPSKLEVDARDINAFVNDLTARLHKYDMFLKNLKAHAGMLKKELDEKKG